ncbi:hypothetical protein LCGC14_2015340, partial [marine sediment metagenome]
MSAKRRAALNLLERLERHEMEAQSRKLGQLRDEMAKLEQRRDGLLEDLHNNAHVTGIESAPYVGTYVRSVRRSVAGLETAISGMTPQVQKLEEAVLDRFRSIKTFESARLRSAARDAADRAAREAADRDEMVLLRWG